jgi:hypothetical protein
MHCIVLIHFSLEVNQWLYASATNFFPTPISWRPLSKTFHSTTSPSSQTLIGRKNVGRKISSCFVSELGLRVDEREHSGQDCQIPTIQRVGLMAKNNKNFIYWLFDYPYFCRSSYLWLVHYKLSINILYAKSDECKPFLHLPNSNKSFYKHSWIIE